MQKYNHLARQQCIKLLIERINKAIQAGNLRKVATQKHVALLITPILNRKQVNRAVSIARHPGPFLDFKKGDLDDLLIGAGYKP